MTSCLHHSEIIVSTEENRFHFEKVLDALYIHWPDFWFRFFHLPQLHKKSAPASGEAGAGLDAL